MMIVKLSLFVTSAVCIGYFLSISVSAGDSPTSSLTVVPGQDNDEQDNEGVVEVEHDVVKYDGETFLPSKEWQTVKPGQPIPAGLHVRLNMQTGEKEAKLMDSDDDSNEPETPTSSKPLPSLSQAEIERALRDLRTSHSDDQAPPSKDGTKPKKGKPAPNREFRSYDELKKEYADMGMTLKSDTELMRDLMSEYKTAELLPERRLGILEDLEYLVHQIDNGKNFIDMGGLSLVKDTLNGSLSITNMDSFEQQLHLRMADLAGAAAQSNPKVQVALVDNGVLHVLVRNLAVLMPHWDAVTPQLHSKLLYAIAALTRGFPHAQQKFIQLGGVDVLDSIVRDPQHPTSTNNNVADRLRLRVITLLSDLITEAQHIKDETKSENMTPERKAQYEQINWAEIIEMQDWCPLVIDDYLIRHLASDHASSSKQWDRLHKLLDLVHIMMVEHPERCKRQARVHLDKMKTHRDRLQADYQSDKDSNEFAAELSQRLDEIIQMCKQDQKQEL